MLSGIRGTRILSRWFGPKAQGSTPYQPYFENMGVKPEHYQCRSEHADLQLKSWHSDGFYSPTQLATAAHFIGLQAVALPDNESCEGQKEMQKACDKLGIINIPAMEFHIRDYPMRLISYHASFRNPDFLRRLDEIARLRQKYVEVLLEHLKQEELEINPLDIERFFPEGLQYRQQVAEILVRTGKARNFGRASDTISDVWREEELSRLFDRIKFLYFSLDEILPLIHEAGGIPIWANFGVRYSWKELAMKLLGKGKWGPEGIMGFQIMHGRYYTAAALGDLLLFRDELRARVKIDPILTIGSDFHDGRREDFGLPRLPREDGKADGIVDHLQAARQDKSIIMR